MADEWLRAAEVQAMAARWGCAQTVDVDTMRQAWRDVETLLAQDERWRVLVGELLAACHCGGADCEMKTAALENKAQAALDGGA